jgi:hypothetical protein
VGRSDTKAARDAVVDCARRGDSAVFAGFASAGELPAYDDEAAWQGKTIDGDWLADFLADPGAVFHRRGVSIVGARIVGGLDLECAQLEHRVNLVSCQLGTEAINLHDAGTRTFRLSNVRCGGVDAMRVVVSGSLLFRGLESTGPVDLVGAHVDGTLSCQGATLRAPGRVALNAERVQVGGFVVLAGLTAAGEVSLSGATVGGRLDCTDAHFDNSPGTALQVGGASIGGDLLMTGVHADGEIGMVNTAVGGDVGGGGAVLTAPDRVALWASRTRIAGNLFLEPDFRAVGQVRLSGATVGGNLRAAGARVACSNAPAADFDGIRVEGNLRLTGGFEADGQVRLSGAAIGGNLDCGGSTFSCPGAAAIDADGANVTGAVYLNEGFVAHGEVRLAGTLIGGYLSARAGRFANPGGVALTASRARVSGSVALSDGFSAQGEVRLVGVTIGGDLDAEGAHLAGRDGNALDAARAHVGGSVLLRYGLQAQGRVRVGGATIGNDLRCTGGRFDNRDDVALSVTGARVDGEVALHQGFEATGAVALRGTTAGTLRDDRASWPELIDIDGFRYDRLVCPAGDRGWRARRGWLRRQREPSAQGYVQLASVYRAAGDESDARRILIDRHNALIRPPKHWREHLPSGLRAVVGRTWRRVLRYTIGHGYSPARSLLIAVPLVAALAVWLGHARAEDMLIATDETPATSASGDDVQSSDCTDAYPCVQPVVYALDNVVPIVDLGQRSRWAPDQSTHGAEWWDSGRWLAAALWAAGALGWILATLVAASFTGVVRRE